MIPPSTRDLINIGQSKYAVVVAAAQRARVLSDKRKNDENYRLSSMVTEALDDIINSRVTIVTRSSDQDQRVK
ncbi:MAG: DNA-directed RNA polymerase subunit omega [Syntrophomonadaceae bacterium]|nr:DNA-directed RNA polymerase subunit omega [Syntrophomonadaceae bacterium]